MKLQHIGLYLNNSSDKKFIVSQLTENKLLCDFIDLSNLKGTLFSAQTIEKLIDEEFRHDRILVCTDENTSLSTMSSGQQKRALLTYLIAQQPDYLVLDDVYSNMDKATQQHILQELKTLSETTLIIQLFFRRNDLLPFIQKVLTIDEKNNIVNKQSTNEFTHKPERAAEKKHKFVLPNTYTSNYTTVDPLIELRSVSVCYEENHVISDVNWTIRKGEFWQLVGPNGSGKSTLVSMICGDNPKAYGQDIMLFGRKKGSGETIWDIKRQIGYFTPAMMVRFTRNDTVENMIISGLNDSVGLYVKPTDLQKDIAQSWVEMLGTSFRNKLFLQLSIGQQRMVMVARAMVKHPPLLILDEPTIELDDENSALFIEMVQAIAAENQVAIIYISHRDEENLRPSNIFELVKTDNGYTGVVK
jgi:molybdate transport system ATP-binding protein